ncbi:MAG: NADH-quinone oxidoreductase subunit M [Alphaproteobacteria bacterium]|nr:NADH-quinone oxidoreductase subunit M [Alphaproteobacteria bacterium]
MMPPILSIMIILPLVCACMITLVRGETGDEPIVEKNVKHIALFGSLFVLAFALFMIANFDKSSADFQFVEKFSWFTLAGLNYHLGVDGISVYFILLSALLTPVCILASWNSVHMRIREYMIAFLVLESLMIGTFSALDTVLFYVFFEGVLIPMFLIIGVWGGPRRIYASFKFFLFTLLGSVLMLIALLALYVKTGTTDIPTLMHATTDLEFQRWIWLAFFASFAVKMPMWPVHTWLPDAHVEAPTAGSVILAGVLLKMGGYGFLRFSLPILPLASMYFAPLVLTLSVIAIIYTSLVALVQEDMKKLIAYSSVAHMGFVTLGIFSFTQQGIDGAIFQMLSHGIISAALFLCVGVVYDRLHTREISRYGGLVKNMPNYATVFMVFMLGSVGLPGTTGFVGEFLTLVGTFQASTTFTALAATGLVLGAAYMLLLYRKVVFGPQVNQDAAEMQDLSRMEKIILIPLAVAVIYYGIFPAAITDKITPSTQELVDHYRLSHQPLSFNEASLDGLRDHKQKEAEGS